MDYIAHSAVTFLEHYFQLKYVLGDSHVAGKKYWIISQVVEVITSKSNEIYHEWPEATSDKFHYFYK